MNKLEKLNSLCKCGVSVEIDSHNHNGFSVEQEIETISNTMSHPTLSDDIGKDIYQKMVELNKMVTVYFYPENSVGFYTVYHHDLDMALDEALSYFEGTNG